MRMLEERNDRGNKTRLPVFRSQIGALGQLTWLLRRKHPLDLSRSRRIRFNGLSYCGQCDAPDEKRQLSNHDSRLTAEYADGNVHAPTARKSEILQTNHSAASAQNCEMYC